MTVPSSPRYRGCIMRYASTPSRVALLRSAERSSRLEAFVAYERVWPPFALRVCTARLELRLPTCADIVGLVPASYHAASAVRKGAAFTPTELLAREQARSIAEWSVDNWVVTFGVL